ncbi:MULTISPECIES: integrase core domain-containing protein [Pseudomonas]|uniref:integrase core domain-containing protein n=1 Tax=Pseudomonas TaxID=286 RepID=UPI001CE12A26|nr:MULTISPECIES: integrase core domain-containing protein [unclassified Pseudomonas]
MIESIRYTSTVTDQWREIYNHQRPHQALDFNVPASRYRQSELCYQEVPAELEYGDDDEVRTVQANGELNW